MGNAGSGGHCASGRKPDDQGLMLDPLPEVAIPDDVTPDERRVWQGLAPHARVARTLSPATSYRFWLLCRAIVMEQRFETRIFEDGLTYIAVTLDGSGQERRLLKGHPLCGAHRSMMQRVEAGLVAFRLGPTGRPLASQPTEKPGDALQQLQARVRKFPPSGEGTR